MAEEKRPCGYLVTMSKNSACGTNGYLCDDCQSYFEGYNQALEDGISKIEEFKSGKYSDYDQIKQYCIEILEELKETKE